MVGTRIFADANGLTARLPSGSDPRISEQSCPHFARRDAGRRPACTTAADPRRSASRDRTGVWRRELFAALCCVILCATASATQESVDALASRAAAAREAGNLKDALALYRKGVEARPDWDEGRWYVATLLYEMDRYADAREAFVDVLRRQPTHAGALGLKGLCEFELRRYDRALADLLEAGNLGVSRSPGHCHGRSLPRSHPADALRRVRGRRTRC